VFYHPSADASGISSGIRPDGTPSSSFTGPDSIIGPWGITIVGNDHVWVANGFGKRVTELCGVRTETCPPGYKTGDPVSPPTARMTLRVVSLRCGILVAVGA
jgi:hypothetical protein